MRMADGGWGLRMAGAVAGMVAVLLCAETTGAAEEWWARTWYRETEPSNGFKTHVALSGGGEDLTGNESGLKLTGRGMVAVRRKMLTLYVDGDWSIEDKEYGALGTLKQTTYVFRDTLRCDLGSRIYTSAGGTAERDDVRFVKSREGLFWGLGYDWPIAERLQVTAYGAAGHDAVEYDVEAAQPFYEGADSESSAGWILSLGAVWQILDSVSLRPDGLYVIYTDGELENRWEAGASLVFDVAPHLSLMLRYEENTEQNPVLEAIAGESHNTALKWMFRVNY